nr:transmembrane protein [Guarani virophage]
MDDLLQTELIAYNALSIIGKEMGNDITKKIMIKFFIFIFILLLILLILFFFMIKYINHKCHKCDKCHKNEITSIPNSLIIKETNNTQKDYPSNFGFVEFPSELLGYNPKKFDNYAYIH